MKIPLQWLHELVEFDATPAALADRLTFAGLEVEAVAASGADLTDIVAAAVTAVRPHPNADRLRVCEVNDGTGPVQVVCGASNFEVGDKVPLARPGATLANGTRIKPATLRGEKSFGMLCAADELGVCDDHAGLMILPPDTVPGTPMADIIGPPDHVLTVEVTPNRPDCMSMLGIAREVAALYGRPMQWPAVCVPEPAAGAAPDFEVRVDDAADCPRYIAWRLADVKIRPSPWWLQRRLFQAGIRPINNVVDITNYVMLESGQPLHAFDQALLAGARIHVRRARPGEVLVTLDDVPRKLTPDMLVIADADRPVALAGIMGGAGSGIMDGTSAVVLESACFNAGITRRTSRALGLLSESASRFERGVDVFTTAWAARRAVALMMQLADARPVAPPIDVFPVAPAPRDIACRFDRLRRLLGVDISDAAMTGIFEALELEVAPGGEKSCTVRVPAFRPDLEGEADLAEEVARMHGLDKIPLPPPRRHQAEARAAHQRAMAVMRLRDVMAGAGLTEAMTYSFVSGRLLDMFERDPGGRRVPIPNPISADHGVLRNSLLPQMVETLGQNRARQVQDAAFFEIGRVFYMPDGGAAATEMDMLAIGLMGAIGRPPMDRRRAPDDEEALLWIKGILENLCRAFKFDLPRHFQGAPAAGALQLAPDTDAAFDWPNRAAFAPGRGFVVMLDGQPAGRVGLVRPDLRGEWRIHDPVAVAELQITPLLAHLDAVPAPRPPPVYPAVQRDLALRAPRDLPHVRVMEVIMKLAPPELTDARLFDIFEGKQIGAGFKSMAYALTYQSRERTLKDEEVNAMHEVIIAGVRDGLRVEIRAG